jgi:multidrug efflux pump subunit AcrA (membrane-fusion protein)
MKAMNDDPPRLAQLERQYAQLRQPLSQIGLISQGSVQDRTDRCGGGAGYQWTRKVAQKTVTVSLTAEQFARMSVAVGNYRKLRRQLKQMEMLSRRIIFQGIPHLGRRKRLSQKVLGTK